MLHHHYAHVDCAHRALVIYVDELDRNKSPHEIYEIELGVGQSDYHGWLPAMSDLVLAVERMWGKGFNLNFVSVTKSSLSESFMRLSRKRS